MVFVPFDAVLSLSGPMVSQELSLRKKSLLLFLHRLIQTEVSLREFETRLDKPKVYCLSLLENSLELVEVCLVVLFV